MIKRLINKLLGKPDDGDAKPARPKAGKRVEVPPAEHGIDPALVDDKALKVVATLQEAGHQAYIVGGAVRDMMLGLRPKDFDVATSARPNEVRGLFRNCRIIGRRFRLAHILVAGGKVIETATFRKDPTEALDLAEDAAREESGIDEPFDTARGESGNPLDGTALVPRRKKRGDDADLRTTQNLQALN